MNLLVKLRNKIMKNKISKNVVKIELQKVDVEEMILYETKDRSDALKFQDEINNELWLSGDGG